MLIAIPTIKHLSRMYFELAKIGASSVGADNRWPYDINTKEELVALACDMSRFDPRLFDILVEYFVNHWQDINPAAIRRYYRKMKCPQTIAVICEFLKGAIGDDEAAFFVEYLVSGLSPLPHQFYFYNLYTPGGKLAQRATEEGLYEFKKWGFFACERPVIDQKNKRECGGSLDANARRNILRRLLSETGEIHLKDYLKAVQNSISRQQALLDIKSSGLVQATGKGRGTRWKLAACS